MSYIKKLVVHGFKSFPRKTDLPFTKGINVILGPNGSGKSNITDALCFVLGRLSIKSMRAAKASNLIFSGTKVASPAKEASVEIIFDNLNKVFPIQEKELSLKRIVRRNGQSIYKINNQKRTRQEVLSILGSAGIDPNGFNIILQGEIQNFVRMQAEERREVIEEVAGISIYESRKEKSLKEIEKTENKLKEVNAILKERTAYLNNLEKEKEAALKHQKMEEDIRRYKKSIIYFDLEKKKKQNQEVFKNIEQKNREIKKIKQLVLISETTIENLEDKISEINSKIQKQTGLEQEKLNQEIADLRAELAGLVVKRESHEKKLKDLARQKLNLQQSMEENEISIKSLKRESPTIEKIKKELEIKKKELEKLEEIRKRYYVSKIELKTIKERILEKKSFLQGYSSESIFLAEQIENLTIELFDKKTTQINLKELKLSFIHKRDFLESLNKREIDLEKTIHTNSFKIEEQKKIVEKIGKLDICPLCKNKITSGHIHSIVDEAKPIITNLENQIKKGDLELNEIYSKRDILKREVESINSEVQKRQSDILKLKAVQEKNYQIKIIQEKIEIVKKELKELQKKEVILEEDFNETSNIEEKYETLRMDIEDISLRNKENLSSEITFKQRELERAVILIKKFSREEKELEEELIIIQDSLIEKEKRLIQKRKIEEELTKKAKRYIEEREKNQKKIRENENELSTRRNTLYDYEQTRNNLKIDKARFDAERENLEIEILQFPKTEIMKAKKEVLIEKLRKAEDSLVRIGTVNMRALEVYEEIKLEYDTIKEKVEIITKEKEGIFKIINEIDIKKKRIFFSTLKNLNEIFTRNFAQISNKGQVFLEIQNKKSPFEGGINVIVKTGHGKYFDIKSLSGGEQTMVALSLIFAIQELKPYAFYILDEIDAALDKRNSERLARLLKKYMKKGQYLVITHNDEIITGATNLYGVSMHEGISKVISLKV